jgi:peptide deformylase
MTELVILQHPHPALRMVAAQVETFDAALADLAAEMLRLMYGAHGVGLAANQVGVLSRLIVLDVSPSRVDPVVMVNPVILKAEDTQMVRDGCLSVNFGRTFAYTTRAKRIKVAYQDLTGAPRVAKLSGLSAACVQHEVDHLDGKLFIDLAGQKAA